ncbi:MAG: DNA replication/repair protein RecF [Actinomycetota bacterium]|nr:DNA replication/repair protein RecF [Actinomycetota bacterium]
MRVDELALEDWRNYERESLELSRGLNLVVGPNAQGKTNLLEAVHCLSGFGSPRAADTALVRHGTERALLHAAAVRRAREVRIDLEIRPGKGTRALLNKTPVQPRLLGDMCVSVFFGPDELSLIKGSPDGRRRFLDELVVKLRPARDGLRREFDRTLKQRNALLKSAPRGGSASVTATLDVWDAALARAGAALTAVRLEVLAGLMPLAAKRYEEVAGGGRLELEYASSWIAGEGSPGGIDAVPSDTSVLEERLRDAIAAARPREIERGVGLVGPQRDDVTVLLASGGGPGGSPTDARTFASQGDQRTCALALKLGEHDLLSDALGEEPILLLDDVFSELDPARRAWLADAVRSIGQTLVSTTEPEGVEMLSPDRVLEVSAGRVRTRD